MKPKFVCTKCGKEITWGVQNCQGCGTHVEWPVESATDESSRAEVAVKACGKCGMENYPDASFCSSCGAQLKGSQKQQGKGQRQGGKQEKGRDQKKKEASSSPIFSWKIIFGFLGFLIVLIVALELFTNREQTPAGNQAATQQMPTADLAIAGQITELEKTLAANPSDMQTILKLANLSHDGRFFDKAISNYKKFLEKNPKDANARVDLGICYFESGQSDLAQKEMLAALKDDPKHLQAHFNLGIVNLKERRIQEANDWFKKTIALAPAGSEIGVQAKQFLDQHSSPLIQNK